MFIRCIAAEWLKLRHSYLWTILVVLPMISALIGSANFYLNQGVLRNEWYSLWSQVSLFYGEFFFPILIAICCAYMARLEHQHNNWNMIMTAPVSAANIFLAKLFIIALLLLFVQGTFFLFYFTAGKWVGLTAALPGELPGWLLRGWLAGLTISTLQLALSLRFRSYAVPIGIGLCATFVGLGMYVIDFGMFFPHSLLTIGMGVLSQTGLSSFGDQLLFWSVNLLYSSLISFAAIYWMSKVRTKSV